MKLIRSMLYSTLGRVCHGYYGSVGPFVTDDFGNAVPSNNGAIRHYMIQGK